MIEIKHRYTRAVIHTVLADTLVGADLRGANLREADLFVASMSGVNLLGADMHGADLRGADMRGADLSEANLRWADMRGVALCEADLRGADMCWVDLRCADMRGANLYMANLRQAKLRQATLIRTILPENVPIVPDIDAQILAIIEKHPDLFDMSTWHCGTTYCRGGWAITLAGEAGKDLVRQVSSPATAATLIYAASRPNKPVPDFFTTTAAAIADIRACAAQKE